ncbi:DUF6612 family protein [Shouchella patagoniensis]|uniref:DUF6612 family protein n=1 Tax=Shouchella patagoniensis TaxID=228576 RepID=UPI000995564F|nr:DUF6612 family protein [Shouchella patagoniensis]
MENFENEQMTYILQINKETFHQEIVSMNVVAASEDGDMSMEIVMAFDCVYSIYDEIKDINVPSEAIDEARALV